MELADIFRYVLLLIIGVLILNAYVKGQVSLRNLIISIILCAVVYFIVARPDKY
ncbi:MAG: hypothetical protein AMQ74_00751 [Candidatus Methanofastidiosum methylothiophilum]|uniref:Uncharacterized protein n=1 Tax=Candidatus Methanofastidiosum methylothiophilum TaxID=1705564 RepID=A0A150J5V9_9EURY|nr:MAG: hypothetical protein AMQ74_00751 [Candidatus Methanofastidiosum methylthiophilus]